MDMVLMDPNENAKHRRADSRAQLGTTPSSNEVLSLHEERGGREPERGADLSSRLLLTPLSLALSPLLRRGERESLAGMVVVSSCDPDSPHGTSTWFLPFGSPPSGSRTTCLRSFEVVVIRMLPSARQMLPTSPWKVRAHLMSVERVGSSDIAPEERFAGPHRSRAPRLLVMLRSPASSDCDFCE